MINENERKEILEFFKDNTNIDLPCAIKIDSGNEGKNILISVSRHGNEPVGSVYAYEFINDFWNKKIKLDSGSITFVLANPEAFRKNVRYINSDRDYLPEDQLDLENNNEHKRATEIKKYLTKNKDKIDLAIDVHSVSTGDTQIYICNKEREKMKEILIETSIIPMLFFFDNELINASFLSECTRQNIDSLAMECGNHTSDNAINIAKKQIGILLDKYGILKLKEKIPTKKREELRIYETVGKVLCAPGFKWLIDNPKTDYKLTKGQEFAIDSKNGVQKAKEDCLLVMPSKEPKDTDTDAGFLCIRK